MSDSSSYENVPKFEQFDSTVEALKLTANAAKLANNYKARMHIITTNSPLCKEEEAKLSEGRRYLRCWLGKKFRVVITDGRVLVGYFNCTDKDANIVLSMCAEYLQEGQDARILGNVMIPGKHIVSVSVDLPENYLENNCSHITEIKMNDNAIRDLCIEVKEKLLEQQKLESTVAKHELNGNTNGESLSPEHIRDNETYISADGKMTTIIR